MCTGGLSVRLQVSAKHDDRLGTSPTMCAAPSRPVLVASDSSPVPPEQGQPQVTSSWVAQTITSRADASTEDEVCYPPGFSPAEPTVHAGLLSRLLRYGHPAEESYSSAARCLKSFTERVLKKVDSSLIL